MSVPKVFYGTFPIDRRPRP